MNLQVGDPCTASKQRRPHHPRQHRGNLAVPSCKYGFIGLPVGTCHRLPPRGCPTCCSTRSHPSSWRVVWPHRRPAARQGRPCRRRGLSATAALVGRRPSSFTRATAPPRWRSTGRPPHRGAACCPGSVAGNGVGSTKGGLSTVGSTGSQRRACRPRARPTAPGLACGELGRAPAGLGVVAIASGNARDEAAGAGQVERRAQLARRGAGAGNVHDACVEV